jgi:cellulose synthase/poly-beta-1,6-N-acetylglucosamine synthase-like glycosyltransferase
MTSLWMIVYALSATGLAVYGINSIYLTVRFLRMGRYRHMSPVPRGTPPPSVTVQLPLYNEMNVVRRLLSSVLALDYLGDRMVVQLLDDSSDGTVGLVRDAVTASLGSSTTRETADAVIEEWRRPDGLLVQHVRRRDRSGYKAGALHLGMRVSVTDAYAIFDADFVPGPDFLRRTLAHLSDPGVAFVQTRWGHLNAGQSLLTRAQALAMDAHFAIEQQARFASGLFFNFNGTAGVWRRTAIEEAGGWQARTLTEDLDLSYRAQLAGWRGVYDGDVVVPGEVPRDLNALKNQQFRWAKGSLQTGRLILGRVARAPLPIAVRVQATVHLLSYLVHPFLLALLISTAFLIREFPVTLMGFGLTAAIGLGPPFMVAVAQRSLHPDWSKRVLAIPFLAALGMGIAVVSSRAALETLFGVRSGFVRTPKEGSGRRLADYRAVMGIAPALEWAAALAALWTLHGAISSGRYSAVPFLCLYVVAFGYVGLVSLTTAFRSALGVTSGR